MKIDKNKLEKLMALSCLTNKDLACRTGVSISSVANIRTGRQEPRPSTVKKLCDVLKCKPIDLIED